MDEVADRPKWLLELENRKRKPRLAHEAGAGSPCMVCSNACPGLDLHFWRKICKNCKCSRDDHDVQDDDFPQFHLLFGPSNKYKKKSMFLRVNEKQVEAETVFEWVPPDTTKELASDYMKALPTDKLPIKGTVGAALRRQLLQKQLPLHDIDYKACDELSDDEKKQFEKYLENIKKYVGQGKVTKILSARPFDRALLTPANATEMQHYSPEHKKLANTNITQLRTPSSFTKLSYGKNLANSYNNPDYKTSSDMESLKNNSSKAPTLELYSTINNPKDTAIATSESLSNDIRTASPFLKDRVVQHHDPNSNCSPLLESGRKEDITPSLKEVRQGYESSLRNPESSFAESVLADALRPPSTIRANEIIGSTLDPKGLMYIREKLTTKYSTQDTKNLNTTPSKCQGLANDKTKDPAGSNSIPYTPTNTPIKADGNLTKLSSENREYPANIEKTVLTPNAQVTKSVPFESHLMNSEKCYPHSENEQFNNTLGSSRGVINPSYMPQISGNVILPQDHCSKLKDSLSGRPCNESLTTHAPHSCNVENQVQSKLSSSSIPTKLLHSEELYNQVFPHEPISIMKEVTQNVPNVEHLRGAIEEMTLESSGPQKCNKCAEEIRIGDVVVVTDKAKTAGWHPGCFVCDVCNELLADLVYFHYKNKLYCGRDLATLLGIPRCFACDELIFVREYTVAEGHNYHVKHFCCWDCDVPLAGQQYITENDRPLCLPCYQTTYAKTCNACNGVIAANQQGVSVKDLDFHASESCFCCYECKKNLLNCRMAIKEGKLFCSKECISSFLVSRG